MAQTQAGQPQRTLTFPEADVYAPTGPQNSPYSTPLDKRQYQYVQPQVANPYAQQQQAAPRPDTGAGAVAAAKGAAAKAVVSTSSKTKTSGGAQAAATPAPGSPQAHMASPDWKQAIMRAASAGDAYNRALLDLVIRARQQAAESKNAGKAPFVPIRDYRSNMMVLVVADGTEFVFDLKDEKGSQAYITALTSAGYDPTAVQQYAEATSRGLAQVATSGPREFTEGAGEVLNPEVFLAEQVKQGLNPADIGKVLSQSIGGGG